MSNALLLQQTTAPTRDQIREQVRQTVREATQAAEQAARAAADARNAGDAARHQIITIPMPPNFPGTTIQTTRTPGIPPEVEPISIAFFAMIAIIVVGLPIMRAIARRIDRGSQAPTPIPREIHEQLQQLSQSVDAIAIEVERISEGQRFTTKMLSDRASDVTMMVPGATRQG